MRRSDGPDGDNLQSLKLALSLAWSKGALRNVIWTLTVLGAGGGFAAFWDDLGRLLGVVPVFAALLLTATITTSFLSGSPDGRVVFVPPAYVTARGEI